MSPTEHRIKIRLELSKAYTRRVAECGYIPVEEWQEEQALVMSAGYPKHEPETTACHMKNK